MNYSQVTVDILQNPKYAGAIDSIGWLTDWIDSGFGMVISLVSFLIIIVSMLKNVLAGCYVSFPKFWDKVDEAHKEVATTSWIEQIKGTLNKDINGGSLGTALLRILPNIKSLTDFETNTVSPKAYFIRAIPLMIATMIIGAFIYNGYYRDTAAVVIDFGSEMVSRVLLETDPIAAFDRFTGTAGRPTFASDNALDAETQLVNKISTSTYTTIIGEYKDITTAEAKRALANSIELKATEFVGTIKSLGAGNGEDFTDGDHWKPILQVVLTHGEIPVDSIHNKVSEDGNTWQFAFTYPVSDLTMSSTINANEPIYVRLRVNMERKAATTGSENISDIVLHIAGTTSAQVETRNANLYMRTISGLDCTVEGTEDKCTVTYDLNAGTFEVTPADGVTIGAGTVLIPSSPIALRDNAQTGKTHYIAKIELGASSNFLSSETAGLDSFDFTKKDLGVTVE